MNQRSACTFDGDINKGSTWKVVAIQFSQPLYVRQQMRTAEGQQVGAIDHTAALAPLLPFQLQSGQHFESFLKRSLQSRPTEGLLILDDDLRFAASLSSLPGVDLSELRKPAMGLSAEMKRRWGKMTAHVRSKPTEAIRTATVQRDMGFTAIFLLLANWGDVTLPAGLCIQRNGSHVAKTGLMLTDFIP